MRETKVWAYVFITTKQPRRVVQAVRKIQGVVKADGLFGMPDAIAIVEGRDIASMDAVIDRITEVPDIVGTDSKVADGSTDRFVRGPLVKVTDAYGDRFD
jgi:phosphohistidine swiveling domain-containing protein